MQILMDYNWPGNVRELENAVERAVVLANAPEVPAAVLPEPVLHAGGVRLPREPGEPLSADASLFEVVAEFERRTIIEVLDQVAYSQTEAAAKLRVPLSTLNQKIKRLDIPIRRKSASN
jgi:DNA-binding NtrC family response regulator